MDGKDTSKHSRTMRTVITLPLHCTFSVLLLFYCTLLCCITLRSVDAFQGVCNNRPTKTTSIRKEQQPSVALFASSSSSISHGDDPQQVSNDILKAMRKRTRSNDDDALHLATDLYDASTGLHSEGVWHNCLAGIAALQSTDDDYATRIADSLLLHSWDGTSFQRRVYSGNWDHSILQDDDDNKNRNLEQADYYVASKEHRCVQHGMALVFWSELVAACPQSRRQDYRKQQVMIGDAFLDQYWDGARWATVSKEQGGGTIQRPSASANKVTTLNTGDGDNNDDTPYYRAVDQALGMLGCLGILSSMEDTDHDAKTHRVIDILRKTSHELLTEFGYGPDGNSRTYIGLDRNQNFWHDGWVLLALVSAREYLWSQDKSQGEIELRLLLTQFLDRYGHKDPATDEFDGTVWHWSTEQKKGTEEGNVKYCGDNALLFAITRELGWAPGGLKKYQSGFWEFIELLRSREEDGLSSVADVYEQVRLHPNTELAALLVWPHCTETTRS